MAASVSTGPRQEADFRCANSADQGWLLAQSANWNSRPGAVFPETLRIQVKDRRRTAGFRRSTFAPLWLDPASGRSRAAAQWWLDQIRINHAEPVIEKILNHLGLEPPPKAPARGVTRISREMHAAGR